MATALRDWGLAFAFAVATHLGVVSLIASEAPGVGAAAPGVGGIEIGLGPAGGAAGGAKSQSVGADEVVGDAPPEPPAPETSVDAVEPTRLDEPAEFSLTDAELAPPEPAEDVPAEVSDPVETEPIQAAAAGEMAEEAPVDADSAATSAAASEADGSDPVGSGADTKSGSGDGTLGGGGSGFASSYLATLQAWIEKHKTYPFRAKSKGQEGVVVVYFVIDRTGRVLDHRIEESSNYRLLDQEAIDMLKRAQPFPPFADDVRGDRLEFTIPIQFFLS